MRYTLRLRLRRIIRIVLPAVLFPALGVFLFMQLGPSCTNRAPDAGGENHCGCQGFEIIRSRHPDSGAISSVCLGRVVDRYENFLYWAPGGLSHTERLVVTKGNDDKPLVDTIDAKAIQRAAAIFDRLGEGWRTLGELTVTPAPDYTFVFYKYAPSGDAATPLKADEFAFGVGDGFITFPERKIRGLATDEQAQIRALVP